MVELETFRNRLSRIGINIDLASNFPWVYLVKINGIPVTERLCKEFTTDWDIAPRQQNNRILNVNARDLLILFPL